MNNHKETKPHLPDIGWLLFELNEIHQSMWLIHKHGESDLTSAQFQVINNALTEAAKQISTIGSKRKVFITHDKDVKPDLVCNGPTPIFLHFWSCPIGTKFEDYFYRNLNPDIAPIGFLEQLDKLLQLAAKKPLVIFTTCDDNELQYCDIIKQYIESQ